MISASASASFYQKKITIDKFKKKKIKNAQ